jgi:hypothetical protein
VLAGDAHPTLLTVVRDGPQSVKGWDFVIAPKGPGDGSVNFERAMPPQGVPHSVYKSARKHGDLLNDIPQVQAILSSMGA